MKKILNEPSEFVRDSLIGLTSTSSGVARVDGWNVVVSTDRDPGQVAVISGGGAGHEPAHAGYVGAGMLSAAVVGEVYTSPSVDAVLTAIRSVAGPAGVLLVIKNYTGDRLNFGLAAEIARSEGIPVTMTVVADDIALPKGGKVGARGLAGVVLVNKIAGAAAASGLSLEDVTRWANQAAASVTTMGVALSAGTVPAAGVPNFDLASDEIEWGLGIHGEPGLERSELVSAKEIAKRLTTRVLVEGNVEAGQKIALMVNGLGATPPSELDIVAGEVVAAILEQEVIIERVWSGNFLTALDTHGCSVSVLSLSGGIIELLDAPTHAPAWPGTRARPVASVQPTVPAPALSPGTGAASSPPSSTTTDTALLAGLRAAADALLAAEGELTELDRIVGDGDLGASLARGSRRILEILKNVDSSYSRATLLREIGAAVREHVGGTSGPLYSIMFLRAAFVIDGCDVVTPRDWADAFAAAVEGVQNVGGATLGDCTMLDALLPASNTLNDSLTMGSETRVALDNALIAAKEGSTTTVGLRASLGRSSYIGDRAVGHVDPGAYAVALWFEALVGALAGEAATG